MFLPVQAQDADDMQRGVARISLMNGEVSVRRGDSGEWVAGVVNAPLITDDRISTGPNSRAEVQFDAANILRIGANAEIHLSQLEANRFQMELARGTVTFRVLRPSGANVELDTPSVSVRPNKQGIYRITVNEGGETEVISRAGEVEVFTPRGSQWVTPGQMMMARGSQTDPEFQMVNAPQGDEWDRWNDNRDRALMQSSSYQYVGPGVYGVEDLDNNGSWQDVQPYGEVWHPNVAVGDDWAPYRNGRWSWEDWYGWTWVSSDPWGWAPYHYGRWFNQPGIGWCWYPGARGIHHYWSPALVSFFGYGGGGFGVGFGFGHIGWVPLAPYEVFHPWWGRGYYGRGFNNFNVTNVNVYNTYRNARFNGVSGMSAGDFRSGRFNSIGRVAGDHVREAGLVRGQMPIGPSAAHTRFSDRSASYTPRSTNTSTRFFTHQQTSAAERIPFSQQTGAMAGNRGNESQGRAFGNGGQQQNSAGRAAQGPGNSGNSGWARFGSPANQGAVGRNPGQQAQQTQNSFRGVTPSRQMESQRSTPGPQSNGLQRFGQPGVSNRGQSSPNAGSGNYSSPRYNAPSGGYSQPQRSAPSYNNPGYSQRSAPNYSNPGYSQQQRSAPSYSNPGYSQRSAPSYSAPRSSAPSYSAPRSSGGGGGYSAPRSSGGGGGGYSTPRSSGGGGGYSAPRSSGGGGYSAPRSSGGGGGGGGGSRSSGGGGRGHR